MRKLTDVVKRRRRPNATASEVSTDAKPEMMVCHTSFATNNPYFMAVKVGERLPADHPMVLRSPWAFISSSAGSEAERQAAAKLTAETMERASRVREQTERGMRAAADESKPKEKPPIPRERQRLAIRSAGMLGFTQSGQLLGGHRIRGLPVAKGEPWRVQIGEIADSKWVVVRKYPECFVPVWPPGLAIEDAVMCIADEPIKRFSGNAENEKADRIIYPNQMIHKDDELVAINPSMFVPVGASFRATPGFPIIIAGPGQVTEGPRKSGYVSE
jgi:hypothetical protein